jgi:transcriptional regulator with XRE-family HTH domain
MSDQPPGAKPHPLLTYRLAHKRSQQELADAVGTNKSTISRMEGSQIKPSLELMRRIAKATDGEVTTDMLLAWHDPDLRAALRRDLAVGGDEAVA